MRQLSEREQRLVRLEAERLGYGGAIAEVRRQMARRRRWRCRARNAAVAAALVIALGAFLGLVWP
jgi:chorismate mutase